MGDLVHFSFGMVELPEGKMKSREGTVVDADDLIEEMVKTAKDTSNELGKLDGLSQEEADDIARFAGLAARPRKKLIILPALLVWAL